MATVYMGSAHGDENGKAYGGKAGDQTGREVSTRKWYKHSKGWRTLRAKDPEKGEMIAEAMEMACDNDHVGYDQWQRDTLLKAATEVGYDISKVVKDCETDCSALVRVCCAYAWGKDIVAEVSADRFYTGNMVGVLLKTGLFDELEGDAYNKQSDYLMRGDIQCTRTQGHVEVVVSNGDKAGEPVGMAPRRTIRRGSTGAAVTEAQRMLGMLGYDLGGSGADGDFGRQTEKAVKAFQTAHDLEADGVVGKLTWAALDAAAASAARYVVIEGGNCHVRSGPGTQYDSQGVAKRGERLRYGGVTAENGWLLVEFQGGNGWVSGKYGRLEV